MHSKAERCLSASSTKGRKCEDSLYCDNKKSRIITLIIITTAFFSDGSSAFL